MALHGMRGTHPHGHRSSAGDRARRRLPVDRGDPEGRTECSDAEHVGYLSKLSREMDATVRAEYARGAAAERERIISVARGRASLPMQHDMAARILNEFADSLGEEQ
jgi:hypothetical protein